MRTVGPEEDGAKRPTERKQPVAEAQGHRAGGATDEIRHDHYRLLGEEEDADRAMRVRYADSVT